MPVLRDSLAKAKSKREPWNSNTSCGAGHVHIEVFAVCPKHSATKGAQVAIDIHSAVLEAWTGFVVHGVLVPSQVLQLSVGRAAATPLGCWQLQQVPDPQWMDGVSEVVVHAGCVFVALVQVIVAPVVARIAPKDGHAVVV